MRGNLLDVAVAVILAVAFFALVQGLVHAVVLQIIAALVAAPPTSAR